MFIYITVRIMKLYIFFNVEFYAMGSVKGLSEFDPIDPLEISANCQ